MKKIGTVGAGFTGAVLAYRLAHAGYNIDVFDHRSHLAGNCHSKRDSETGVMVHVYGPHIFHTNNEHVWKFVNQFDEFMPFVNRVKAIVQERVYTLPINLLTINNFFGKVFSPSKAKAFLESISDKSINMPQNLEEQALKLIGRDLYRAFLLGYTTKQWGIHPTKLQASILKRLPVRFNYDDNYYNNLYQGIPRNGYTYIVERLLDHPLIKVHLNERFDQKQVGDYSHVFYSGPIDGWFNYKDGRLGYRTLDFETSRYNGDYQGNAVINYCDLEVPWTRISEHKHFMPWESHNQTIIFKEYSRFCGKNDLPYYPICLAKEKKLLRHYVNLAMREYNVSFVGRLGTYRYLDMHVTIREALEAANIFLEASARGNNIPTFFVDPLQ
ncbi:UDP-galactopyranose mutase [Candidatus Vallotia tarda]|uniref:Probable UDP-galactopyranose mutase n=1 Tax=Candidatus Vallotiella hemipterorum TaxID=1177213 RepID=A0A916JS56_9BURK|nr:UDP-galactopyranose mutase [Candidatus Vallotia tarda]CAG7598777.1 Probable UDP-galactopyranose mutase [Candidatus Vallotia tarda]